MHFNNGPNESTALVPSDFDCAMPYSPCIDDNQLTYVKNVEHPKSQGTFVVRINIVHKLPESVISELNRFVLFGTSFFHSQSNFNELFYRFIGIGLKIFVKKKFMTFIQLLKSLIISTMRSELEIHYSITANDRIKCIFFSLNKK